MRDIGLEKRDTFNLDPLFNLFLKVVALFFVAFAVRHWLLAIGYPDTEVRFDTMVFRWQVAITALAILQPIASLGLWGATRWGYVVWFMAAAIEVIMYILLQDVFGAFWPVIYFHLGVASVMLLYLMIESLRARRA